MATEWVRRKEERDRSDPRPRLVLDAPLSLGIVAEVDDRGDLVVFANGQHVRVLSQHVPGLRSWLERTFS